MPTATLTIIKSTMLLPKPNLDYIFLLN